MGWAAFYDRDYPVARRYFGEIVTQYPGTFKADKSVMQIGEAYLAEDRFAEALPFFSRLVDNYRGRAGGQGAQTAEKLKMLRGEAQQSARQLAATALIKIGECHEGASDVEYALDAYEEVVTDFFQETPLVQNALLRRAEMLLNHRGLDAGINAYQAAIDESAGDRVFQAKLQAQILFLLFEHGRYEQAITAYRTYINGYSDVADEIGRPLAWAWYQMGISYQRLAEDSRASGGQHQATTQFLASAWAERTLMDSTEFAESDLVPDAWFAYGLAYQRLGTDTLWQLSVVTTDTSQGRLVAHGMGALEHVVATPSPGQAWQEAILAYRETFDRFPRSQAAEQSLLQWGRLLAEQDDYLNATERFGVLIDRYPSSQGVQQARLEQGVSFQKWAVWEKDPARRREIQLSGTKPLWDIPLNKPQAPSARVALAKLLSDLERFDDAVSVLDSARSVITAPNLQAQAHFQKGLAHFGGKRYVTSITEYDSVIAMAAQGDSVVSVDLKKSALFSRGMASFEIEDFAAAASDLEMLIELGVPDRSKVPTYRMLGAAMVKLERDAEAVAYYQLIIESTVDPKERTDFQLLLAQLYHQTKQWDEAIAAALEIKTNMPLLSIADTTYLATLGKNASLLIGDGYFQKADAIMKVYTGASHSIPPEANSAFISSAKALLEGTEIAPKDSLVAMIGYLRGQVLYQAQEWDDAASAFSWFVKWFPDDRRAPDVAYFRASSLSQGNHNRQAARAFGFFYDQYPNSTYHVDSKFFEGENYYNAQGWSEADSVWRRLLTNHKSSRWAHEALYNTAWCHYQLATEEGLTALQAAYEDSVFLWALTELQSKYRDSPHCPEAQFTIGDFHYNKQSFDDAIESYTVFIERYGTRADQTTQTAKAKESIEELMEIKADEVYRRAYALWEEGGADSALVLFSQVAGEFEGTESEMAALANMGMIYEEKSEYRDAFDVFETLIGKYGDDPRAGKAVDFAREHRDWINDTILGGS